MQDGRQRKCCQSAQCRKTLCRRENEGDPGRSRQVESEDCWQDSDIWLPLLWKPSAVSSLTWDCYSILHEFCEPIKSCCLNHFSMGFWDSRKKKNHIAHIWQRTAWTLESDTPGFEYWLNHWPWPMWPEASVIATLSQFFFKLGSENGITHLHIATLS